MKNKIVNQKELPDREFYLENIEKEIRRSYVIKEDEFEGLYEGLL